MALNGFLFAIYESTVLQTFRKHFYWKVKKKADVNEHWKTLKNLEKFQFSR